MKRIALLFTVVGCMSLAATSCRHRGDGPDEAPAASATPVPADSPLAKIKAGMSKNDVEKILGQPTSTNSYLGGKAWNPFNFGGDSGARLEAHYKGQGLVLYAIQRFSMEMSVEEVRYDPNNTGYQKK